MEYKLNEKVSKRFMTGLNKLDLTIEDLKSNWFYIGGESGHHLNYFKRYYGNEEIPDHHDYCICGHKIKNNCFISDGEYVLSVGESCINKFVPRLNRICEECGDRHRNRKDNKCKKCRRRFTRTYDKCIVSFN
tara:strand:- start:1320 stop:1718 length:399 start_codon:yes stop_codon:yes gene_type:complete